MIEARERVRERRIILSLVKAKYKTYIEEADDDGDKPQTKQPQLFYANHNATDTTEHAHECIKLLFKQNGEVCVWKVERLAVCVMSENVL